MNARNDVLGEAMAQECFTSSQWHCILVKLPAAACLLSDTSERTVLDANEAFYRLIGYDPEEFQYRFGGRVSAITIGDWSANEGNEEIQEWNHRLRTKGADDRWVRIAAQYTSVEGIGAHFCVFTDRTEEKGLEEAVSYNRTLFERVGLLTGNESFLYDIETRKAEIFHSGTVLNQITDADQERSGSFEQALIKKSFLDELDKEVLLGVFEAVHRGDPAVCEVRFRTEQGELWIRVSLEFRGIGNGGQTKAVGILQNITELKSANLHCLEETQLSQALLSDKDAFILVDVTADRVLRAGGWWYHCSGLIQSVPYSRLLTGCLCDSIHPDDCSYYLEFMELANLSQVLGNGIRRLDCRVKRIEEQGEVNQIHIDVFLFQNPFTQNTEALICAADMNSVTLESSNPVVPVAQGDVREFERYLSGEGDIAYLVDMESFILIMGNEAFYRRVGLTKEECCGKTCYWLMHRRSSPCPFCGRSNWSRNKFYCWKNWNAIFKQNYLIKNKIISWKGRDVLLALAIDVANGRGFFDSIDDGGSESHSVLSGIQRMSEAKNLESTIAATLEIIGNFFEAGAVQYWSYEREEERFSCGQQWMQNRDTLSLSDDRRISQTVNRWINKLKWTHPVIIENQEAMLCHSYEMYELLKEADIWNQRWVPLREGDNLWGVFVIMNLTNHLKNNSFLESFTTFIIEEWRRKSSVDEMVYASLHDEITGLSNQKVFDQYIKGFSPDDADSLSVVAAAINDLESINTQKGSRVGDDCLRHFASKLQSAFQEGSLFRTSGSVFIAILPNFTLEKLAARLEEMEDEVVSCRRYSISVGYSWDNIEKELPQLAAQAVQSMRFNQSQRLDSVDHTTEANRQKMVQRLMENLKQREFEVFLQPKINLFTGGLMGAEALVRFRDKKNGIVPPSHFIDILEKNNLIRFVDFFVFEECCRILERWQELGWTLPVISFNFSRLTLLERDIAASVQSIFKKYRVPKDKVEIEITESVGDLGKGVLYQAARQLYQEGFSISLDDFGTKYTNLDILSELDFDMLKVDKSLVASLTKRRSNQIILQNIINMCRHLNISIIAEGIETKAQETVLRSLGCRYGQGYLYGRPMAVPEFEERFMKNRQG